MPKWKQDDLKNEVKDLMRISKAVQAREMKFDVLSKADMLMAKFEKYPTFRNEVRNVRSAICFGYATNNLEELSAKLTDLVEAM